MAGWKSARQAGWLADLKVLSKQSSWLIWNRLAGWQAGRRRQPRGAPRQLRGSHDGLNRGGEGEGEGAEVDGERQWRRRWTLMATAIDFNGEGLKRQRRRQ